MPTHKDAHAGKAARRNWSGMRGFAMMDVAFGAAILGIIVMGTLQIFSFGQRQIISRVTERSAYDMARTQIEEIIADSYDNAVSRVDTGLTLNGDIPATRTITVTFVDDPADSLGAADLDGPEDFKEIRVDVDYGPSGSTKTVTLTTVMVP